MQPSPNLFYSPCHHLGSGSLSLAKNIMGSPHQSTLHLQLPHKLSRIIISFCQGLTENLQRPPLIHWINFRPLSGTPSLYILPHLRLSLISHCYPTDSFCSSFRLRNQTGLYAFLLTLSRVFHLCYCCLGHSSSFCPSRRTVNTSSFIKWVLYPDRQEICLLWYQQLLVLPSSLEPILPCFIYSHLVLTLCTAIQVPRGQGQWFPCVCILPQSLAQSLILRGNQ